MRSKLFLYVALAADFSIALTKFIAAAFTGSSAMISEGIHSVIDLMIQVLLLLGINKSKKKPDAKRPFGYGKELYFWSFIVSLLLFSVGGCISFYEGILRFKRPMLDRSQGWNYTVLAFAFVFNTASMIAALNKFNRQRGGLGFWKSIKQSKDSSVFIVLLGDFGDLIGLLIAFLGVYLGQLFHNPYYDGIASIIIGIILMIISLLLVQESRSLLMGESAGRKIMHHVIALTEADPSIVKVKKHFSMYMAPEEIVLQMITVFKKNLDTKQITDAIQRIIKSIQEQYPSIKQIFIEPG